MRCLPLNLKRLDSSGLGRIAPTLEDCAPTAGASSSGWRFPGFLPTQIPMSIPEVAFAHRPVRNPEMRHMSRQSWRTWFRFGAAASPHRLGHVATCEQAGGTPALPTRDMLTRQPPSRQRELQADTRLLCTDFYALSIRKRNSVLGVSVSRSHSSAHLISAMTLRL